MLLILSLRLVPAIGLLQQCLCPLHGSATDLDRAMAAHLPEFNCMQMCTAEGYREMNITLLSCLLQVVNCSCLFADPWSSIPPMSIFPPHCAWGAGAFSGRSLYPLQAALTYSPWQKRGLYYWFMRPPYSCLASTLYSRFMVMWARVYDITLFLIFYDYLRCLYINIYCYAINKWILPGPKVPCQACNDHELPFLLLTI